MIADKSILAIVPARGGSKGVKRKNIRDAAGKPLIAWTIEEAKRSKYIDRLILSSEDEEIIAVAKAYGCEVPFVRPSELSKDETPGIDPVIHAVGALAESYDYIVLLQPTSPLRKAEDIDGCIEKCVLGGFRSAVSVTEPDKSPYWMYLLDEKGLMTPVVRTDTFNRRQDLPKAYALNGAVYVIERELLLDKKAFLTEGTVAYRMPKERSLDIDTELDLAIAGFVLSKQ